MIKTGLITLLIMAVLVGIGVLTATFPTVMIPLTILFCGVFGLVHVVAQNTPTSLDKWLAR